LYGVTVFTPTVNPLWKLERAYNSLLKQTHQNLQWIVISDGSTEDVRGFVEGLRAPFEVILKENTTRQGKFISYNRAIELANRDFFCILDDDDELFPDSIEKLLNVWNDIPHKDRIKFWGVAGTSKLTGELKTAISSSNFSYKSGSTYGYVDSNYDEMKFRFNTNDEKFSLTVLAIVKRFPYDPVTFHIPPSTVWSVISRDYLMRYTDLVVRIYHHSPEGIMSSHRTYQVLLQRTLGIVIWTSDDLNYNIKYFKSAPRYFLKAAFNYARFKKHLRSASHKIRCPANDKLRLETQIADKIKIRNHLSLLLVILVYPASLVWFFLDTKRGS
jgi:glycosyltransferase involved in cell wall biosynthesis